jgi:hypothetical protein
MRANPKQSPWPWFSTEYSGKGKNKPAF